MWWVWLIVSLALAGGVGWFLLARKGSSEPDDQL
jgi:hypothetical protein